MRKRRTLITLFVVCLVAAGLVLAATDHPSCSGSEQPRHCAD